MRRRMASLAVAAFLAPRPAAAQEPRQGLEKIVITASRSGTAQEDLPARAVVVSGEEIAALRPRHVDDLLTRSAAMPDLQGEGQAATLTRKIMLYGMGDQYRTLVLVDGFPIQEPSTGWVDWHLVNMKLVDRVEVLKGPYSGLYGSGMMGGVVQIVTKTPSVPSETLLEGSYGSFETREFHAYHGGSRGPVSYALAGRFSQTDGYVNAKVPAVYHGRTDRQEHNLSGKASWRPAEDASLTLNVLQGRDILDQGRLYDTVDRNDLLGALRYDHALGDWRLRAGAFIGDFKEYLELDRLVPAYTREAYRLRNQAQAGGDAQVSRRVGDRGSLMAGLDGKFGKLDETVFYVGSSRRLRAAARQTYLAPYLQAEFHWLDGRLTTTGGLRWDSFESHGGSFHDTNTGVTPTRYPSRGFDAVLPRGGLSYRPDGATVLRAAFGRGFSAPQMTALYVTNIRNRTILPDPGLNPEKLWSCELGAQRSFPGRVSTALNFHQAWGDDFIVQFFYPNGNSQWGNVARIEIAGADAEVGYRPSEAWSLKLAHAWQRSKIARNAATPGSDGKDYAHAPPNKFLFAAGFDDPGLLQADLRVRYTDRQYADVNHVYLARSRWNVDLALSRTLGKGVTLRVDLQNLLDDRYDVFDLSAAVLAAPGFQAAGTLSAAF